jgi:hypothetical protein
MGLREIRGTCSPSNRHLRISARFAGLSMSFKALSSMTQELSATSASGGFISVERWEGGRDLMALLWRILATGGSGGSGSGSSSRVRAGPCESCCVLVLDGTGGRGRRPLGGKGVGEESMP